MTTNMQWWVGSGMLRAFCEHLVSKGWTAHDLLPVIERPWCWTAEFTEWSEG